jgi:hypothetical protein
LNIYWIIIQYESFNLKMFWCKNVRSRVYVYNVSKVNTASVFKSPKQLPYSLERLSPMELISVVSTYFLVQGSVQMRVGEHGDACWVSVTRTILIYCLSCWLDWCPSTCSCLRRGYSSMVINIRRTLLFGKDSVEHLLFKRNFSSLLWGPHAQMWRWQQSAYFTWNSFCVICSKTLGYRAVRCV